MISHANGTRTSLHASTSIHPNCNPINWNATSSILYQNFIYRRISSSVATTFPSTSRQRLDEQTERHQRERGLRRMLWQTAPRRWVRDHGEIHSMIISVTIIGARLLLWVRSSLLLPRLHLMAMSSTDDLPKILGCVQRARRACTRIYELRRRFTNGACGGHRPVALHGFELGNGSDKA